MAKLLNFIESSTDHSNTDIVIAEFILRNVHDFPNMSIYEMAEACHTSPATITRFCKRFDNVSFKELKEYAKTFTEFNNTEVDYQKIEVNINQEQLNSYFEDVQRSLEETKQMIQSTELLEIVGEIHKAKKISIFGVTFSHLLARNAQFKFMRLGKYATAYGNHENQITEAESLTPSDAAIVISFSGQTRFIIRLVKMLKEKSIPIIAITGDSQSFLAKNADDMILVSNRRQEHYKSPITEEISMLTVINSIYLVYSAFLNSRAG